MEAGAGWGVRCSGTNGIWIQLHWRKVMWSTISGTAFIYWRHCSITQCLTQLAPAFTLPSLLYGNGFASWERRALCHGVEALAMCDQTVTEEKEKPENWQLTFWTSFTTMPYFYAPPVHDRSHKHIPYIYSAAGCFDSSVKTEVSRRVVASLIHTSQCHEGETQPPLPYAQLGTKVV